MAVVNPTMNLYFPDLHSCYDHSCDCSAGCFQDLRYFLDTLNFQVKVEDGGGAAVHVSAGNGPFNDAYTPTIAANIGTATYFNYSIPLNSYIGLPIRVRVRIAGSAVDDGDYISEIIHVTDDAELMCYRPLLQWSNNCDLAGSDEHPDVIYESGGLVNSMRIPARLEVENVIIPEFSTVKDSAGEWSLCFAESDKTYRLTVGYAPSYIHDRVAYALMHNNVTIQGFNALNPLELILHQPYTKTNKARQKMDFWTGEARLKAKYSAGTVSSCC